MIFCKKCGERWIGEKRGKSYTKCPYCETPNDLNDPIIFVECNPTFDLQGALKQAQNNRNSAKEKSY